MNYLGISYDIKNVYEQIENTSAAFASDMVVSKFIQGLPFVGVVGGMTNPVYYHRVIAYAQMMYKKRFLMERDAQTSDC